MVKKQSLKPLCLILSEESFLRDQAVGLLKARVEEEGPIDFNFDRFDAALSSASDIVAAAETMPFASPYRLILVHNIDKITKENSDTLTRYATNPNETTVLALVGSKLNRGTELLKQVKLYGDVLDRKPPAKRELPAKVVQMFGAKGLKVSRFVADALINTVGSDLKLLDLAIEKLEIYAGEKRTIEIADIAETITSSVEIKTWQLLDDLSNRNSVAALSKFKTIIFQGKDTMSTIMMLNGSLQIMLRNLIIARAYIDRGVGDVSELAKATNQQDWKAKITKRQADGFGARQLEKALKQLAKSEQAIKSGSDPIFIYEQWIIEFVTE